MNIEQILAPIPGPNPAGENMRYSSVYDRIKEARRYDDLLAQGEWQTDVKTADWKLTIELCTEALMHQSKDLQIAVWLTESLLHHRGYQGLATGLEIILKLLEKYWDHLYPEIDDGDLDYRIGPLTFLNEKLPEAVFQVAVCDPRKTKGYSYYLWEESRAVGFGQNLDKEQKKRRQIMIDDGKVTGEEFSAAVTSSPIGFYRELAGQLEQCRLNLSVLDDMVNVKFNPDPPGFTRLAESVESCSRLVGKLHKDKQKSEVVREENMDGDSKKTKTGSDIAEVTTEPVRSDMEGHLHVCQNAISDISITEQEMWALASAKLQKGDLKNALDQLLAAASLAPSVREKNRFLLLLAKLCLQADRPDLARPIAENLHDLLETLKLEQWEHPAWIADVIETLYRCLVQDDQSETERAKKLFEKLCTLNITKAAAYRTG